MTIGKSISRIGAAQRVSGRPIFSADLDFKNPLTLLAVRSARDHARIRTIDTEKAKATAGVVAVFTAADVPGKNRLGIINKDMPLLAEEKTRFRGEPIALVAAETESAARAGRDAVDVIYEDLPAVFTPDDALSPDAPQIHENGNQLFTRIIRKGDAAAALSDCAVVIDRTYTTSRLEHAYLEPDAGAGYVDENGTLVVYASTQNPHYDQGDLVTLLAVPENRIRIVQAATGGGFGSKLDLNVQGFIALALYHLSRPVRYVYSREEAFLCTAKRHPTTIQVKTGARADGRLKALSAEIRIDTGAYGSYGIAVAGRAAVHLTGPYEIDHVDIISRCLYTNNPFSGAMRGFGVPQAAFAHESQMDLIAGALGMDPLYIRKINALGRESRTATGQVLTESVGMKACLEAVTPVFETARKEMRDKASPAPYIKRGAGLGAMFYGIGNTGVQNPSTAAVEIDDAGRITLYTGCADIGQGSSTVLCQIAADTLTVSPGEIRLVAADTKYTTNAGATSASRQTYISGNAVRDAAQKLLAVLITEAVDALKTPKTELHAEQGRIVSANNPDIHADFARLARRTKKKGIPLRWTGYFDPKTTPLDENGQGIPYATYAFAAHAAQVSVNILTGEVTVEKITAAHDVGRAIHPESVRGQIYGGVAMGVGFALMEEFVAGETKNLSDYLIPTSKDMPTVDAVIVECGESTGPFGAKGVGEPALIPTAPAVINALADALGTRIEALPATLERVLEAARSGQADPR